MFTTITTVTITEENRTPTRHVVDFGDTYHSGESGRDGEEKPRS